MENGKRVSLMAVEIATDKETMQAICRLIVQKAVARRPEIAEEAERLGASSNPFELARHADDLGYKSKKGSVQNFSCGG